MTTRTIETVDAWLSRDCDTRYSVSLSNEDGEVRCVGGSDDIDEAWQLACTEAAKHGVPARLMPRENGEVTREWTPKIEITDAQIEALRDEAALAGDDEMRVIADRALAGSAEDRSECERVILDVRFGDPDQVERDRYDD